MWGISAAVSKPACGGGSAADFWEQSSEEEEEATAASPPPPQSPAQRIKSHRRGTTPADAWAAEEKELLRDAASSIAEANEAIASGRGEPPPGTPGARGGSLLDLVDQLEEEEGERFEVLSTRPLLSRLSHLAPFDPDLPPWARRTLTETPMA